MLVRATDISDRAGLRLGEKKTQLTEMFQAATVDEQYIHKF